MNTKEFVRYCVKNEVDVKGKIGLLTDDDIIRLKAELNAKIVNGDKWNIWIFVCSSLFTIVTLIITLATLYITTDELPDKIWKEWVLNQSNNVIIGTIFIWFVIVCICCKGMFDKSRCSKALCYLIEYSTKQVGIIEDNDKSSAEKIEQIIQRHKIECQRNLEVWKQKQSHSANQINLYEIYITNMENLS